MLIAYPMVHTTDITLNIGNERMNLGQDLDGISSLSHHDRLMGALIAIKDSIGTPSIGTDYHCFTKGYVSHFVDLVCADSGYLVHLGEAWLLFFSLCTHHYFCLSHGTTAPFARLGGTKIGIIHLDQASQRLGGLSISHGFSNLVSHHPDGLIACDLQHSLKGTHGDTAFLPSHQKDHPEPFPQRGPCLMKDGACGEGQLIAACLALVQMAGTMKVCVVVVITGAAVTLWPPQAKEVFLACFFKKKLSTNL
jgi:hypothetical protein